MRWLRFIILILVIVSLSILSDRIVRVDFKTSIDTPVIVSKVFVPTVTIDPDYDIPDVASGDWCSPVVVRPPRRWKSVRPCVRIWSNTQVATRAEIVIFGGYKDVFEDENPSSNPMCGRPFTHEANAGYIADIRSQRTAWRLKRRSPATKPIFFVHMSRFDLVSLEHAKSPGFQPSFLVKTQTPISQVIGFFESDQSTVCMGKCKWGGPTQGDAVYYVSVKYPREKTYFPLAMIADLQNPAYRQWRVQRAKRFLTLGGFDAVMLNHKFDQYATNNYVLGSPWCQNLTRCKVDSSMWSALPDEYSLTEYVDGWVSLAADLKAAGVPYVVRLSPNPWLTHSPEAVRIHSVLDGALLVMVNAGNVGWQKTIQGWMRKLRREGVNVLPIDSRCGLMKGH